MATLFYSVMGEGRGHAARARAMIERLRDRHRLVLFTSHDALRFLRSEYDDDPEVEVHELPGLVFHYSNDKLDLWKTISEGLKFWAAAGKNAKALAPHFDRLHPDLVVCDFEPLMPRAARAHGVPVLSLDHQHFMTTYDLSLLPARLRRWAWVMSWSVWAFGIRASKTVVSSFYKPPLRAGSEDAVQVGPLLRPAVEARTPSNQGHVLSYLRRATPPRVVEMLSKLPLPVKVYGLGAREPRGSITFCEISETTFLDDLASCDSVIAAAGNQLLGEALYFGKPVLAMPEHNHHEQCINACFLEQLGGGDWRYVERITQEDFQAFLDQRETYRKQLEGRSAEFDGAGDAAAAIESALADLPRE